ncbi:sugar phosphate nucleotidyltransferase [Lachnospiraceae bacterium 62-26]
MLTVILAGGKGTRILEETELMPKAMVKIGDRPIIEHIMGCYEEQGFNELLILTGYKGKKIFDYFKTKKNITFLKEQGDCMIV